MRSDLHSVAPLRAFRDSRTPCVSYHAVADAWSADFETRGADRVLGCCLSAALVLTGCCLGAAWVLLGCS
eukprot:11210584-Lingulodinium_polyedra.AAC.1